MLKLLQSQQFMRNPVPQLTEMRNQGPLIRIKIPLLGRVWLTTTQRATAEVLKRDDIFRVRKHDGQVAGMAWWMPRSLSRLTQNMLASDEPEHTRLRGCVDAAFHRRAVHEMEAEIRQIAESLAGDLLGAEATANLITDFARPLPMAVICELLGLPQEDRRPFSQWAQGITTVRGILSFLLAIRKLRPLTQYLEARIDHEKRHGGSGLIAALVSETKQGGKLSDDELLAMVFLLLLAGHETTTHLLSGSVLAFLQNPEQLRLLTADWNRLDLAVEECLRFVSPVQTAKPRFVHADCEIEGIVLKQGSLVMPFLAAANFDPDVFVQPERFDISRKPNRHIEFGTGIHFCLGNQLARLEMKAGLHALFSRWPDLDLAVPDRDIAWNPRFGMRSLKQLPIRRSAADPGPFLQQN